jgi:hypothetical protein
MPLEASKHAKYSFLSIPCTLDALSSPTSFPQILVRLSSMPLQPIAPHPVANKEWPNASGGVGAQTTGNNNGGQHQGGPSGDGHEGRHQPGRPNDAGSQPASHGGQQEGGPRDASGQIAAQTGQHPGDPDDVRVLKVKTCWENLEHRRANEKNLCVPLGTQRVEAEGVSKKLRMNKDFEMNSKADDSHPSTNEAYSCLIDMIR